MANKTDMLIEALEPIAEAHDLELVTVEVAGTAKNPILRIYLDTLQGGITLDELAAAQEWVDAKIEEIDPFKCSYVLEVSSPGIDRPLRKREDFQRFEGEETVIHVKNGEPRPKVQGILQGMDGDDIVLDCNGTEVRIAFDGVKRANIIGKIDFNARSGEELEWDDPAQDNGKE